MASFGIVAMMQAVYYRDRDGVEPVSEFLSSLPLSAQAAIDHQVGLLNRLVDTDPPLPFPQSSQVEGEMRELRCHFGSRLIRILYRRSERLFVLLHAFEKSTGQIPEADKESARKSWADFKTRMNAHPRRPPRAAGHDAP